MHQPSSFHNRRRGVESLDRCLDTLSSHSHGLGLAYNQCPESHFDGHISVRFIVSHMAAFSYFFAITAKHLTVSVPSPSLESVNLQL